MQSSGSVKSLAKSVSEVSLHPSDSKADLVQDQSPRTVTGASKQPEGPDRQLGGMSAIGAALVPCMPFLVPQGAACRTVVMFRRLAVSIM